MMEVQFLQPFVTAIVSAVVAAIVGVLSAQITARRKNHTQEQEREQLLCDGMKYLMKRQLLDIYDRCKKAGVATTEDKELAQEAHSIYKGLNGNHLGDKLYDEIMSM